MESPDKSPRVLDYGKPNKSYGGLKEAVSPGNLTQAMRDEIEGIALADQQASSGVWLRFISPFLIIIGFGMIFSSPRNDENLAFAGCALVVSGAICLVGGLLLRGQAALVRWSSRK